jgi:hypothetical protein
MKYFYYIKEAMASFGIWVFCFNLYACIALLMRVDIVKIKSLPFIFINFPDHSIYYPLLMIVLLMSGGFVLPYIKYMNSKMNQ